MDVKFKKLSSEAVTPTRGSVFSAGYDLYMASSEPFKVAPGETVKIKTNLAFEIPVGYVGLIFARSGIATKRGLRPSNCVGVIDSDYRGDVIVALHNDTNENQTIEAKERIAQLIIMPYPNVSLIESDELNDTDRGDGGFGSTGTK